MEQDAKVGFGDYVAGLAFFLGHMHAPASCPTTDAEPGVFLRALSRFTVLSCAVVASVPFGCCPREGLAGGDVTVRA